MIKIKINKNYVIGHIVRFPQYGEIYYSYYITPHNYVSNKKDAKKFTKIGAWLKYVSLMKDKWEEDDFYIERFDK